MNVAVAAFVGILIVQISHPSEGKEKEKCINSNVPDILNLSKCLKGYTDLCNKKTKGLIALGEKVIECLGQQLHTVDFQTQVYIVVQFTEFVLDKATFGLVSPSLQTLCEAVSDVSGQLGAQLPCKSLTISDQVLCTGAVKLKTPSTLNLGECIGDSLQTCKNKKPVTESVVIDFIRVLACLVSTAIETTTSEAVQDLACALVTLPATVFGSQAYHTLEPYVNAVSQAFGVDCSSTVFC